MQRLNKTWKEEVLHWLSFLGRSTGRKRKKAARPFSLSWGRWHAAGTENSLQHGEKDEWVNYFPDPHFRAFPNPELSSWWNSLPWYNHSCGKQNNGSKDVHILISGICEYFKLCGRGNSVAEELIKLTFRWESIVSWLISLGTKKSQGSL